MLNPAGHTWKALAHHMLHSLGGLYIFRGVSDKNAIIKAKVSKCYEECLISWNSWELEEFSESPVDILQQFLYNNMFIKANITSIFMKQIFSYGIRYVIDLYNVEAERIYTWNEMTARGIPTVLF